MLTPFSKTAPLGYIVNSLSGRTPKWLGLALIGIICHDSKPIIDLGLACVVPINAGHGSWRMGWLSAFTNPAQ